MFCYKCGQQNKDDAKFCNNCGTEIQGPTITQNNQDIHTPQLKTPVAVPSKNSERVYAGFWVRFVAIFLDALWLGVIAAILSWVINKAFWDNPMFYDFLINQSLSAIVIINWSINSIIILALYLYIAFCESSPYQATPGKKLMKIKVTDLNGNRISFQRALGRTIGKIASSILFIGYIMAAFTSKKQALHDLMASSMVVKVRAHVHQGKKLHGDNKMSSELFKG